MLLDGRDSQPFLWFQFQRLGHVRAHELETSIHSATSLTGGVHFRWENEEEIHTQSLLCNQYGDCRYVTFHENFLEFFRICPLSRGSLLPKAPLSTFLVSKLDLMMILENWRNFNETRWPPFCQRQQKKRGKITIFDEKRSNRSESHSSTGGLTATEEKWWKYFIQNQTTKLVPFKACHDDGAPRSETIYLYFQLGLAFEVQRWGRSVMILPRNVNFVGGRETEGGGIFDSRG